MCLFMHTPALLSPLTTKRNTFTFARRPSHPPAGVNTWPLIMLSGSTARSNVKRGGGFQELDQVSVRLCSRERWRECVPVLMCVGEWKDSDNAKQPSPHNPQPTLTRTLSYKQMQATAPHAKGTFAADAIHTIPSLLRQAVELSLTGRPGGVYVDLPADVLHAK